MQRLGLGLTLLLFACATPQPRPPSGRLEHGMANCPTAVPGANTTLVMTGDGVDLEITSELPEARAKITELAELQANQGEPGIAAMHTGQHGGSGHGGWCPVVHHGTIVTFTPRTAGVTIHIRATTHDRISEVQREAHERLEARVSRGE